MDIIIYGKDENVKRKPINELNGKTITRTEGLRKGSEQVLFECSDGTKYVMWHEQNCCEDVEIEDICGYPDDLIGAKVIDAFVVSNQGSSVDDGPESFTWTFYTIMTTKSALTLRWYGSSNGCYSEGVDFAEVIQPKE